jgi:ComF family protein
VGPRHGALEQLCDDYKFQSERGLAWVLALWLAAALPVDELRQAGFVLCPVPTAPAHKRERGFDHTKLLAQHLSKITKLPMNSLLWRTNNITQHELPTAAARRQAVKNAFALDKKSLKKPIPPKILLIDDIRTTGATLAACEKALRAAGAKEVRQAVVCYQVDSVKNNKKPPESQ